MQRIDPFAVGARSVASTVFSATRRMCASFVLLVLGAGVAFAHAGTDALDPSVEVREREPARLPSVDVKAPRDAIESPPFPSTAAGIDAQQIRRQINIVDAEDAVKYLPSLFVRKRNLGDTQPVLATRTWGVGSSARTLVYVDDVPISALIANNNTIGAPRWGIVAASGIERVTMLYGPFSAAYPGNSVGGVLRIETQRSDDTRFTFAQTMALQDFDGYRTRGDYPTSQASATFSGRSGNVSWFVGGDVQNSFSQPLSYITAAKIPDGTMGAIAADNKLGQPANVLGAGGLLHTLQHDLTARLSIDLAPSLRATYLAGWWRNEGDSRVQSYLADASGVPTFGGANGFASNRYALDAEHLMQALSLKSDTGGDWDGEAVVTHYGYLHDRQRSPAGVLSGLSYATNGRDAELGGTNWSTLDASATWRSQARTHEISFGAHGDTYELDNPTWNLTSWFDRGSRSGLYTAGSGTTRTQALWMQDAWTFAPGWLATLGMRAEHWRASEGFNVSGGVAIAQPDASANGVSPKATLAWQLAPRWRVTASLGKAVRFPTVSELYQIVSTGSTFVAPNPDLKPERATSGELAFVRTSSDGELRVSLFQENMRDALIAQTSTLPGVAAPVSFVQNVGEVRNRGVEIATQASDVGTRGLDLSGSVTFVDSTILSNDSFVGANGATSRGKHAPNVPRWRATAVATYRPDERWSFTLAGRYSSRQYSTLDNIDRVSHVFGAFDAFLVFDARVQWRLDERITLAAGVDNLTNRDYFLYHPFPGRTFVTSLEATF
jgi:iron complex outermembrane receptor protein